MNKEYLGDSVYVQHDGASYILTTENGGNEDQPSNIIYLEQSVIDRLQEFILKQESN